MHAVNAFQMLEVAIFYLTAGSAAFNLQPPYGCQEVQIPNPENLTQTYFFAAISDKSTTSVPDSLQLSYQIGSFFGPAFAPSDYFIVVSGTRAGIPFSKILPDPNNSISVTDYSGDWVLGSYKGTPGWSSVISTVSSPGQNVSGSISLAQSDAPPAWGCGPNKGTNLEVLITPTSSAAEIDTFKNTNFAHFASGKAHVKFNVDGAPLEFAGPYEAETSYGKPYQVIYSRFIYAFTTVGPYSFVIWHVAPVGEPAQFGTIGYLSRRDRLIVNKCNSINSTVASGTVVSSSGAFNATGLSTPVPAELAIEFTNKYGEHYRFSVDTVQGAGSALPAGTTASTLGKVRGGKVGGRQYNGNAFALYFAGPGYTIL